MANIPNFKNRFSYPSVDGITPSISFTAAQAMTENQIAAESPALARYAATVRTYSVVLSRASIKDIFNYCTEQADPRIALRLAAARRRDNNQNVFSGLNVVQELMFNDAARGTSINTANIGLLSEGIARVSAALTAALLIGRISQIAEQFEHAKLIEEQALEDLDRVVETYALSAAAIDNNATTATQTFDDAFYFEIVDLDMPTDRELVVEWYSPSLNQTWTQVNTYQGQFSSWQIVVDLADAINATSITEAVEQLLAVANTSGPSLLLGDLTTETFHCLLFYPRKVVRGVIGVSINVRLRTRLIVGAPPVIPDPIPRYDVNLSPIKWGNYISSIDFFPVNGAIIIISGNNATSNTAITAEQNYEPTVLYFRRKPGVLTTPDTGTIRFRIQAWQPALIVTADEQLRQSITITLPRIIDGIDQQAADDNRHSQVAVELVNAMAQITIDSKLAGAIIRNDPLTVPTPTSAVQLVAWSTSPLVTAIILDILELPEDIEVAVGTVLAPRTLFSNNPKSARIAVTLDTTNAANNTNSTSGGGKTAIAANKKNNYWQSILDETEVTIYDRRH